MSVKLVEVIEEIHDFLIEKGIADRRSLRDWRVKFKYQKYQEQGMAPKDARQRIAKEEFLSEKGIEYIIYR